MRLSLPVVEVMISLSKTVLKYYQYQRVNEQKQIELLQAYEADLPNEAIVDEKEDATELPKPFNQQAFNAKLQEIERLRQETESWVAEQRQQLAVEIAEERERLHEELVRKAEDMQQTAWEEGHRLGYEAGKQEADAQFSQQIELAQQTIKEANSLYTQRMKALEPDMIQLVLAIAEKVLGRVLLEKESFISYIEDQLAKLKEEDIIHLLVHPEQFGMVKEREEQLRQCIPSKATLVILPDHRVAPGGAILETSFGSYDARIDSQMQQIQLAFQQYLRSREKGV